MNIEILKIIGVIILTYLFKSVYEIIYRAYFGPLSKLPGPKLFFLTRLFISFKQLSGKRWEFFQFEVIPKYGRIVRLGPELVLIADKDLIKDMTVTNELSKSRNYIRLRLNPHVESLFSTIDRNFHKQRRKMLSPAFSIRYIASLEPLMRSCVKDLITKVDELIENKGNNDNYVKKKIDDIGGDDNRTNNENKTAIFNILRLVQSCAIDIIGETSFGGRFDGIKTVNHPLPRKIWLELRRRYMASMFPLLKQFFGVDPYLKEFSDSLIKKRKREQPKKDILQMVIDAKNDDDGSSMTDLEIFDQISEFLIAGSDTVSFTTSMAIILLARNPEKINRLYNEIRNSILNNGDGSYDDENLGLLRHEKLKGLPYLNAVINETMRLWPVVLDGGIGKAPSKDIVVKGYLIPKDTNLIINYYTLHHDPEYWGSDVEDFIPERWLDVERIPKDCYYPFSAGTRNCIGQNFAMMEMRLIIGSLVYKYEIEDLHNQSVDVISFFTPTFKDQCYNLKFRKRAHGFSL